MNLTAIRRHAIDIPRQDDFIGRWKAIYWQPDLFTPQRFVIGVVVEADEGRRAFKVMEKPERIECFFHPAPIRREFSSLASLLRAHLATPSRTTLPSANLSFGEPCFIRGDNLQDVTERLFSEAVLAAKPRQNNEMPDVIGPDTEETRSAVSALLKQMTDMAYERIAREGGQILSDHYLDVTLAPDNGAGSVISVCYKSLPTIEIKMLRAAQDINAYATTQGRQHKAIFLLEPADDILLPAKERRAIDGLIGNECWKLECAGFSTPRNTRINDIASDIKDWAIPLLNA